MPTPKPTQVPAADLRIGDQVLVTRDLTSATNWDPHEKRSGWASDLMPARKRTGDSVTTATVQKLNPYTGPAGGQRMSVFTDLGVVVGGSPRSKFWRVTVPAADAGQVESTAPADDASGLPDWVRVGVKVAEYSPRGSFSGATVRISTVERLTNTQIILDSGNRYRRDTLRLVGDHWGPRLLPVDDEDVRNVQARVIAELAAHEIGQALKTAKSGTVAGAAAMLDELAALVEQARQRVAKLQSTGKDDQ